ncbi:MAG: alcohol dehydrogenase catalytic domain-containing protein [Promethearchaeota archaeon]|nr:MAG: alcohol dehydrogenase catalytic domain-containing protein [Candidatus Lokiarchaeota archaeon]
MKALQLTAEKFFELLNKKRTDPNFTSKIYELITYEDLPEPELINDNWIKIKVKLGGICGTDINILEIKQSTYQLNFVSSIAVPGHEIVGTITEIGSNVKNFSVGERVLVDEVLSCEVRGLELCDACKEGDFSLCHNFDKGDISPGFIMGLCEDTGGGWGEYVVAHKSQVLKIPDSISFEDALISEPLAGSIHGVFKRIPKENEIVIVVGCGIMGLTVILALKAFSNCKIIALDIRQSQIDLAKKLGADEVFLTNKGTFIRKIARFLGVRSISPPLQDPTIVGGGADIVFDCVGKASSLKFSLRLVKPKGTLILIGQPATLEIDWTPLFIKEINLVASNTFGTEIIDGVRKRTLQIALDLISSGQVNVSDFITHKFPLENYKEALEVASNKSKYNSNKVVFTL